MQLFKNTFLFLTIWFLLSPAGYAQCPLTVDAGPDQFVCTSGSSTTLTGSVIGNALGYSWSPAIGLDDPSSLTPNATVTGPFTYTLSGFAEDPAAPNLVTNPAFENGNSGFFSTFVYNPVPITPGTYFLATSPTIINSNFPPCDDHTFGNGTGNMMVVNGTGSVADIWCQTIPVNPNSFYVMSAWVTASPISPPTLQFSIDGTLVGNSFNSSGGGCNWEQFSAAWSSGSAVSVTLCITDQSTSGNGLFGDDFALDDIYFAEACSVSDDVEVDVVSVEALLPTTTILPCSAIPGGMQLDASGSTTGPGISYLWTTGSGSILSGETTLMPTINAEGIYTLTVTFDNGLINCSDFASIEVLPDPNFVIANAFVTGGIDCLNPFVTIDGGGSSSGPTISYEWTPTTGILSGETTQYPDVSMGGNYLLTVTNSVSGCTATAEVVVLEDTTPPEAIANVPGFIDCQNPTQTLDGTGSSTGVDFIYSWTTQDGHIVSGQNTLNNCEVDSMGVYQLIVTNTLNSCTAIDFVNVDENIVLPIATAQAMDSITCLQSNVLVAGNGSSTGNDIDYLWTTDNGNITAGQTNIQANVDQGGTYILTVSDNISGCSASDTLMVIENTTVPTAAANTPETLSCTLLSTSLDGTGSSTGDHFLYHWTTGNGNILSGDSSLMPIVDMAGDYLLTVTDTTNGCTATNLTDVLSNTTPPISVAGPAAMIDCAGNPETLDGTGSSAGMDISYLWTTNVGNILSGETSLQAEVNIAGMYYLTTTDTSNGCTAIDSVAVTGDGNAPVVMATIGDSLDCMNTELFIDGSGSSSGPDINLSWTFTPAPGVTGSGFVTGANTLTPTINAGGTYTLTLTNQTNNCSASTAVIVVQDTIAPIVNIDLPGQLNCFQPMDTLNATNSSQGVNFDINWTAFSGNFVADTNSLSPVYDSAGTYLLTITNSLNGCATTEAVTATADFTPPLANAGQDQSIDCNDPEAILMGGNSSQGNPFSLLWTTQDGNISQGEATPTPSVDAAGTYLLEVINQLNGCTANDEVLVTAAADIPQITMGLQDDLNCIITEVSLSADAPTDPFITYNWTTNDGNIINGEDSLAPDVDAAGTYVLTVTNTDNGCSASDSTMILQSIIPPLADAGLPFTLPCGTTATSLDGSNSDIGFEIFYTWTTIDGNIIDGTNSLMPSINAPGTYIIAVEDSVTGCIGLDTVVIIQDMDAPIANAGLADSLTCNEPTLLLNGSGSSSGPTFTYLWSTTDGNILSGETGLSPQIDAAGTYLLTVLNSSNNCQTLSSVQISDVTAGPILDVPATVQLNCIDTSALIPGVSDASNPLYEWSTLNGHILSGNQSDTVLINATGDYLLTVTDQTTGCQASVNVLATEDVEPPMINLAFPMELSCLVDLIQLNGSGSATGPNISYLWTTSNGNILGSDTLISSNTDEPGSYTLTVTNQINGCTAAASLTVVENIDAPTAIANAPIQLGCGQTEVTLDGTGSSVGSGFSYSWTTIDGNIVADANTLFPLVDAPGNYTLRVFNQDNGCTEFATVTVTEDGDAPTIDISLPDLLTCSDSLVVLDATGSDNNPMLQIDWSFVPAPGNQSTGFVTDSTTLTPTVDAPGFYTLILTNLQNGCTAEAMVEVNENITAPQVTAGPDLSLGCNGETIALEGGIANSVGSTVIWFFTPTSGSAGDPFIDSPNLLGPMVSLPGQYQIIATDLANGCSATDEMMLVSTGIDGFDFGVVQPDCEMPFGQINFLATQGGTPPYNFAIDGSNFSPQMTFDNLPEGNYTLVVQDNDGCTQTNTTDIIPYQEFEIILETGITAPLGSSVSIQAQTTLNDDAIASVVWTPADFLSCSDCFSPTAIAHSNTSFLLEVTDTNGCTAVASIDLFVSDPNIAVFVPNAFSPNGDGINDELIVFANEQLVESIQQFRLFDRWGETVFESFNVPPNDFNYSWDGSFRSNRMDGGVFVWFAEIVLINGETRILEGEVLLIR